MGRYRLTWRRAARVLPIGSACLWIVFAACAEAAAPVGPAGPDTVVSSIEMRPPQLHMDSLGLAVQTSATAYAEDGSFLYTSEDYPERFSWSSSAPSVVSVDQQGSLTGGSWGTATVTASHQGGVTGAMWVTVRDVRLAWTVPLAAGETDAGIAIGADGTIYVASRTRLVALTPQGSVLWNRPMPPDVRSIPAIGADGTLYLGSNLGGGGLSAVGQDGTIQWLLSDVGSISTSPVVGPDGTIYVASLDHHVYAVDPLGEIQWAYQGTQAFGSSSPALASDGTIYVGERDGRLHAINADGSARWTFGAGGPIQSSPAIGTDGTIYFAARDGRLYAVDPDGTERWSVALGGGGSSSPSIGPDGTIYVGGLGMLAIDPSGSVRWNHNPSIAVSTTPILGADGTVYVTSGAGSGGLIRALDAQGRLLWDHPTGAWVWGSPAIGFDGTIFAVSDDGTVDAIVENGSTNGGYAASPWPQARRNRANTGRVGG